VSARAPWPRAGSIAARLFYSAVLWSSAILFVAGVIFSTLYRHGAFDAFDMRLGVYLRALVADVATPGDDSRLGPGQLGEPQFELTLSGWYWQITRLDSEKPEIRSSRSLFAARLPRLSDPEASLGPGDARRGFVLGPDDARLRMVERVIDVGDQGRFLIQVAATTADVERDITRFKIELAITFVLLALALIGSTILQLRYGLRPLRLLHDGVAAIRRGEAEKLDGDYSTDLAPLAGELNLLVAANREVIDRARTQVGNLAHALKTPLSVIVNEAAEENTPLAEKVRAQTAVMRDQVTYYLDRARAAARAQAIGSVAEVEPVLAALARTFGKIHRDSGLSFVVDAPGDLRFMGEKQDLEEMVGNLADNAGKWARRQVLLSAALESRGDAGGRPFIAIVIDDDGPGLPEASRSEMLRRGQRLDETKPGSGLGLSIVTDLAALYGGSLSLEDNPVGGLRAVLRLPAVL
jgi:signal transduction histidine kinase